MGGCWRGGHSTTMWSNDKYAELFFVYSNAGILKLQPVDVSKEDITTTITRRIVRLLSSLISHTFQHLCSLHTRIGQLKLIP